MKGNFKRRVVNGSDNVFIMGTGAYYRDVSGIISLKGRENLSNQMDMSTMGIDMRIYLMGRALKSLSTAICSKVCSKKGRKKDFNVNTHGKTRNSLAFMKVAIRTITSAEERDGTEITGSFLMTMWNRQLLQIISINTRGKFWKVSSKAMVK